MKGKIDNSTIMVEDFNTPFSIIDTTRQKVNGEIEDLNKPTRQYL